MKLFTIPRSVRALFHTCKSSAREVREAHLMLKHQGRKWCRACNRTKSLTAFSRHYDAYQARCKRCTNLGRKPARPLPPTSKATKRARHTANQRAYNQRNAAYAIVASELLKRAHA